MLTNIILDLDGPILDGRRRHYECYSRILRSRGFVPVDSDLYWDLKRNRCNRKLILELSDAGNIYEFFCAEWLAHIEDRDLLELDRIQLGTIDTLERWTKKDRAMTLATMRNNDDHLRQQLTALGLTDFFRDIVVCDYRKGAEGKADQVKKSIAGLVPKDTVWIGDTEVDIRAARRLGTEVIALSCGLRTEDYLRSLAPDGVLDSLPAVDLCLNGRPEVSGPAL